MRLGRRIGTPIGILLLALTAFTIPPLPKPARLVVIALDPPDRVDTPGAIRLRFDRPAVTEAEVGVPLAVTPVAIQPVVSVATYWVDRQTLLMRPLQALQPATRYTLALRGPLQEQVMSTPDLEFVYRPLQVMALDGVDPALVPTEPALALRTSLPVRGRDLAEACQLLSKVDLQQIALHAAQPELVESAHELLPAKPLERATSYELRCADLQPAGGGELMPEVYHADLDTTPALTYGLAPTSPSPPARTGRRSGTPPNPGELDRPGRHQWPPS